MGAGVTLSNPVKLAIASDLTTGIPLAKIADKFGTSIRSISRVRQQLAQSQVPSELVQDWRNTGNAKAIKRVFSALDSTKDVYKGGTLGIAWLKGTGLLLPDNTTQINNLYASTPADWAGDFIDLTPDNSQSISSESAPEPHNTTE